jgi:hypothetical protein
VFWGGAAVVSDVDCFISEGKAASGILAHSAAADTNEADEERPKLVTDNVGILGHVDCGETPRVKAYCHRLMFWTRHPQSQKRGHARPWVLSIHYTNARSHERKF